MCSPSARWPWGSRAPGERAASLDAELVPLRVAHLVVVLARGSPLLVDEAHDRRAEGDDAVLLRLDLLGRRASARRGPDVEVDAVAALLRPIRVVEEEPRADALRILREPPGRQVLLGEAAREQVLLELALELQRGIPQHLRP